MKRFFSDFLSDPVCHALLTVIAGIIITFFHSVALDIVCIAFGAILAVIGLVNIIRYLRSPIGANFTLFTGLIFGALGISVVFNPDSLDSLVAAAFGIIVLYHGIINTSCAFRLKNIGYDYWYISLIFAVLTAAAGITLIVLQNTIIDIIALIAGITLIVEGVLNTWTAIKVKNSNG